MRFGRFPAKKETASAQARGRPVTSWRKPKEATSVSSFRVYEQAALAPSYRRIVYSLFYNA